MGYRFFNALRMMSCLKAAAFTAACLVLAACGPRDAKFNPLHFKISGAAAPPEIVLPARVKPGEKIFGITTTPPDQQNLCCAAAAHVSAPVRKDRRASMLRIGIYVAEGKTQHLRITFPNRVIEAQDAGVRGKKGLQILTFALPRALREGRGIVPITIDASQAPYVLVSIYFE